jgi:hypothetical protein
VGGEQVDEELLVFGAKIGHETSQRRCPVATALQQAGHPSRGQGRIQGARINGQAIHVCAPDRFTRQCLSLRAPQDDVDAYVLALGAAKIAIRSLQLDVAPLESLFFMLTEADPDATSATDAGATPALTGAIE